jgi:hypothetical protein
LQISMVYLEKAGQLKKHYDADLLGIMATLAACILLKLTFAKEVNTDLGIKISEQNAWLE